MKIIYAESEKRAVLTALKSKGIRQPPNWKLIHRETCNGNEPQFDHERLLDRLSEKFRLEDSDFKFAVDVVSNPNERSYLDKGVLKIRYRYVLSAAHQGESKIKSNSREFCVVLINQDKIFRIEDINMMSFRGVNPIAKKNYSIFLLRGHWNCRHTWQREVYLVERDNSEIENNELISKTLEMSKENGLVAGLKSLLSTNKEKITMSDAVAMAAELMKKAEFKFKDFKVDDKTLRVEGEELKEGVAIAWVDDQGTMTPVEQPELTIVDGEKTVVIVVKDSAIDQIKPPAEEEEPEEMTEEEKKAKEEADKKAKEDAEKNKFNAEEKYKELNKKIDDLSTSLTAGQKNGFSELKDGLFAELKKIPALKGNSVKNGFSIEEGEADPDNKFSHLGGKPVN